MVLWAYYDSGLWYNDSNMLTSNLCCYLLGTSQPRKYYSTCNMSVCVHEALEGTNPASPLFQWRSHDLRAYIEPTRSYRPTCSNCKCIVVVEEQCEDLIFVCALPPHNAHSHQAEWEWWDSSNCSQNVQKDYWIQTKKAWVSTPICPSPTQTPSASLLRPR